LEELYAEKRADALVRGHESGVDGHNSTNAQDGSVNTVIKGHFNQRNWLRTSGFRRTAERFGEGGVMLMNAFFTNADGVPITEFFGGDAVRFCIRAEVMRPTRDLAFGFILKDRLGQFVVAEGTDAALSDQSLVYQAGDRILVSFTFRMPILIQGDYAMITFSMIGFMMQSLCSPSKVALSMESSERRSWSLS
jgi:lipopolysaccharide transport system ATP-binding protein